MKKSYIAPATRSIQVNFQGMLATSRITYDTNSGRIGGEQSSNKKENIWGNDNKGLWE